MLLAQASVETASRVTPDKVNQLLLGLLALVAVVLVTVAIVYWVRRKYLKEQSVEIPPAGFGLGELKDLHAQGLLSDEEFAAAKAKIVVTAHAAYLAPKAKKGDKDKK